MKYHRRGLYIRIKYCLAGLAVLVLILLSGCVYRADTLKIGVVFPLSGTANYLLSVKYGLEMATEEINEYKTLGNKKIELVFKDTESNPKKLQEVFHTLMQEVNPDIIISLTSSVSTALSELAEEEQVPLFCLVVSDPAITEGKRYTFRYYSTSEDEVAPLLSVITQNHLEEIGVLYQNDEYGRSIFLELKNREREYGFIVTGSQFSITGTDMVDPVKKLISKEGIVIAGFLDNNKLILDELRRQNYTGVIMGTSTLASRSIWSIPEADGAFVSAPIVYNPHYKVVKDLSRRVRDRYDIDLEHQFAVGYDAIYLLAGLFRNEKEINRLAIVNGLNDEFIFPGIFGDISKNKNEKDIRIPLYPTVIENGQLRYLID